MTNEFSFEDIYQNGLGFNNINDTKSIESIPFDGEYDHVSMDMASAENYVEFVDTYKNLEIKNASEKINMLKKLQIRYGRNGSNGAKSIESFCNIMSMEAEEAAASVDDESKWKAKDVINTENVNNKALKFLATAFNAIAKLIQRIFHAIIAGFKWIIEKIKNAFHKDDAPAAHLEELEPSEEEIINNALKTTPLEFNRLRGKYFLPINSNMFTNIKSFTDGILGKLIDRITQLSNWVYDNNRMSDPIIGEFNSIIQMLEIFPGVKGSLRGDGEAGLPKLSEITEESLKKYNKNVQIISNNLTFENYPNEYCDLILKVKPFKSSDAEKAKLTDICGTYKIREIKKIVENANKEIDSVGKTTSSLQKDFDKANSNLNANLKKYLKSDGSNTVTDDKNDSSTIVIGFKTIETTFKIVQKILKIEVDIQSMIKESIDALSSTINKPTVWKNATKFMKNLPGLTKDKFKEMKNNTKDFINNSRTDREERTIRNLTEKKNDLINEKKINKKLNRDHERNQKIIKSKKEELKKLKNN